MNREVYNLVLDQYGRKISDAFQEAIEAICSKIVLQEVEDALADGNIEVAIEALKIEPEAFYVYDQAIQASYYNAGNLASIGNIRLVFNMRNYRAEEWLRERSSQLIREITEPQKELVRRIMIDGMRSGLNPRTIALDIVGRIDPETKQRTGGVLGLLDQQKQYIDNAKAELSDPKIMRNYLKRQLRDRRFDKTIRAAIKNGKPLNKEQIDKITNRYYQRMLKYRADNIGRTEALNSMNAADYEAFKQALEKSNYSDDMVVSEWDSAGDGRVRHTHAVLNGKKVVGMDAFFTSPSGAKLKYPGDRSLGAPASEIINCRCRVKRTIDYLGKFKNVR